MLLVGSGRRLFDDNTPHLPLQLVSSTPFGSDLVHLAYRPTAT